MTEYDPDPAKIILAGDSHGDPDYLLYLFNLAYAATADAIIVLGDFGYWEHHPQGGAFLDLCSDGFEQTGIPVYFIDGNHECHPLLRSRYGPGGDSHELVGPGFWEIRPGLLYIPRGLRWVWRGKHIMGLGGAYSIDMRYRVGQWVGNGSLPHEQSWWPEEELTDAEVAYALSDPTKLDLLLTHDKPLASIPRDGWRSAQPCEPNARKVQKVVNALQPQLLVHGHMHMRYEDDIRNGDGWTHVIGLDANVNHDRITGFERMWHGMDLDQPILGAG